MSIWNKILVALIGIAALAFFHAAARTVKTYKYWSEKVVAFEKKLDAVRADNISLKTADHEHPREDKTVGVQQLRSDLGRVLANRGRVWLNCQKQKTMADKDNPGVLDVSVSSDEGGFTDKMLLYAFEDGDDQSPGKYLGEFHVKAVGDKQITLASTTQMVSGLLKNVADSKAPWVLYEMMPTDEHEAFATLPEDMRKFVPEEFVKDGQTGPNGKTIVRDLRDYLAIFRSCEMYRTLFADRMESTLRDLKYLTAAGDEVKNQEAVVEKEKTQVSQEDQRARKERDAVASHEAALQRMLSFNQTAVQAAIAANVEYAKEIARRQKEAADLIDRRTRSMAQFGPGTN